MKDFESISHTADLQIHVYGKTLKDLFRNALIGMFQSIKPITRDKNCYYKNDRLICENLTEIHDVNLTSINMESLLVDFLSEALYLSDVNNEAYLDADITELTDGKICARLSGIKISGFEVVEIKAVTYNDLKIEKQAGYYFANIVFDI